MLSILTPSTVLQHLLLLLSTKLHNAVSFSGRKTCSVIEKHYRPFMSKDHTSNADLLIPQEPPLYFLLFLNRKVQDEYSKLPNENQKEFTQQWLDNASLLFYTYQHPRLQLYTSHWEFNLAEETPRPNIRESFYLAPTTFCSHLHYRAFFIVKCHFNLPLFQ